MAGPSVFLSSGDGHFRELLELHQACQGPLLGSRGKVGFLSRCCSGKGPHLSLRGDGDLFFSSCSRKCGVPLELRRGPQGPTCVTSGKPVSMRVVKPLGIPLLLVLCLRSSSGAEVRTSVLGASVRNSAHGKSHEEGGFGIREGGIESQDTPCSRGSTPKTRVCLLYYFMLSTTPLTLWWAVPHHLSRRNI